MDPLRGAGLGAAALDLHLAMIGAGSPSTLLTTRSASEEVVAPNTAAVVRRGSEATFYAPGMQRVAARLVDDADAVHGHGFFVYPNWVVGRQAMRTKTPFIYHPHGMLEPWALARSRRRKRLVGMLFEDRNVRNAGLWRALTTREANQIRALGVTSPIVVAPNGVNLDRIGPQIRPPSSAEPDRLRLLFLGRIHPKKGFDILIPSWASLKAARRDWELVIAGPSEGGYATEVAAALRQHNLSSDVRMIGEVRGEEKFELLRSSDAFVLPSHSEGFPVATLEAMASRLPLVVTRATNIEGVSSHGAGFVADSTVPSLVAALHDLVASTPKERREMGANARQWVEADFAWPAIARTVLDACESRWPDR